MKASIEQSVILVNSNISYTIGLKYLYRL